MPKKENIVSFTLEEIKAHLAANKPDLAPLRAMTDAEIEANAASDPDDPTNDPHFWETSERIYPKPERRAVKVEIDEELLRFMQQQHWNLGTSVNAALRQYVRDHSK